MMNKRQNNNPEPRVSTASEEGQAKQYTELGRLKSASRSAGLEEIRPHDRLVRQAAEASALSKTFVISLLLGSVLLFGAILLALWALPYFGASLLTPEAGRLALAVVSGLFGIALLLAVIPAGALALNKSLPCIHRMRGVMNFVLFPLMRLAGIILRIPKSKVRLAFIRLNNDLARVSRIKCRPDELLILLPHCIQKSTCPHRLTHNIQACVRCGACTVGPLLNLADRYGVEAVIVPGGTVARQMVREKRPKCLIAVACHRDLTSGIRDVAALPVFGVLNERPFGPCINTSVDVDKIEEAIRLFIIKA